MRNLIPRALALADVLAVAAYIVDLSPLFGQVLGLGIKLLLVPVMLRSSSILLRQGEAIFVLFATCLVSLVFSSSTDWETSVFPVLGFLAHLSLTLLQTREELAEYFRIAALLIFGSALLHVIMAVAGMIPVIYGRYWYFHELHPNLGSEIAAAGVLCGVISLRYHLFLASSIVMLASTLFMQGRAAMITIVLSIVLRTMHEGFIASDRSKVQLRIILATPAAALLAVLAVPYLASALMLDDRHRGLGTGFVGRTDQWNIAWNAFLDSPITGQGLGWFERTQELGAHNFFLYGLAEMGLVATALFAMLAYFAVRAFRFHGWKVVSLSPVLAMFMMNDRFINLNPYPFFVWVLFFTLSAAPAPARIPLPERGRAGAAAAAM